MELAEGTSTDWHYHSEVIDFFVCMTGVVKGLFVAVNG
jgi:quercetin dioxygenase-like cupin family protein